MTKTDLGLKEVYDELDEERSYLEPIYFLELSEDEYDPDIESVLTVSHVWGDNKVAIETVLTHKDPLHGPTKATFAGFIDTDVFIKFCAQAYKVLSKRYLGKRAKS